MIKNNPLISVVTVVRNDEINIENTILSVINQNYKNIEYIIIDGNSTDNTKNIVKKYRDDISIFISEPDLGIFDAMNKGIKLATGDWINFMNSGDIFYDDNIISYIFQDSQVIPSIIYGDVIFGFDQTNSVYVKAKNLNDFWKGMPFVHQSSFIHSSLAKKCNFSLNYKLISDYVMMYEFYKINIKFTYYDIPFCKFLSGGISDNNPKTIDECKKYVLSMDDNYTISIRYFYFIKKINCLLRYNLSKSIGNKNYSKLRFFKSKITKLIQNINNDS